MDSALLCDLHTHSTFSDGTCAPAEIVSVAQDLGLGAVALTDHNTSHGLPDFMDSARKAGIRGIAGSEISTTAGSHEAHVLALFLPEDRWADVDDFVQVLWTSKERSNIALVSALTDAGYPLDYERIKAATPSGQVNRSRIADALVQKGYLSKDEAFRTVLRPRSKGGLYDPPVRPDVLDTVRFIRSIGAVPVLAHPFLNFQAEELEEFLPRATEAGLVGMEVLYPEFGPEQERLAADLAARNGLLPSGGSDFHGAAKPGLELGTGRRQNLKVPMSYASGLEKAARDIRGDARKEDPNV